MENEIMVPKGFKASGSQAGLKKRGGLDLALVFSDKSASAAGLFTTNLVKAAPVILSAEHLKAGTARAIIANAGNANACTGEKGMLNARLTAEEVAKALGVHTTEVLVASTGVIGQQLKVELISQALPDLISRLSPRGLPDAASAIMTTDSFQKISFRRGAIEGNEFTVTGVAKGAGMIMPNMATMLCFLISDIAIDTPLLRELLIEANDKTFNRISVDGDTSTNDMVLVLANGASGCRATRDLMLFKSMLEQVMTELAAMIVRDGEGATKSVSVIIKGAFSPQQARSAARTVANSALVKTAFYGQDPNWGRIMAALGRSGITMAEDRVDIYIDDIRIVKGGLAVGEEAERLASERMRNREFSVSIELHMGNFEDWILTSDLTHEYVSINAAYRT